MGPKEEDVNKINVLSCRVQGQSKRRSGTREEVESYLIYQTREYPSIYHELPEHKTAISISVELIQLHLVDLAASTHLTLHLPCLRHCHASVHYILKASKPQNRLSYDSVMMS